ncbi:MAG: hypothetical protein KGO51_12925 [Alphaproteobacteria bacterium]|nr:hypothetical protein [Alphaproteobacteria bacterium]
MVASAATANAQAYVANASLIANRADVAFPASPRVRAWGLAGTGTVSINGSRLNFETDLGYSHSASRSFSFSQYAAAENLTWAEPTWRIGATVGDHATRGPAGGLSTTNFGAYGVWFPTRSVTLSAKSGAFSGRAGGAYAGAAAYWYITPDLAVFGSWDGARFHRGFTELDWTASAQWLPWQRAPISLIAGYTRSEFAGHVDLHSHMAFVAFRLFWNRSGKVSLVGRERTGPVGWPGAFGPQGIAF